MTLMKQELRKGRISLILWTAIISFLLGVCILIYPEMEHQMNDLSGMFADMGGFSAAFGMDKINFGEFMGFFGVECANVLGLGGAFFAALLGISSLASEEKEKTAEFLLTHPISRTQVVLEKYCAILIQIAILNSVVSIVTLLSAFAIGEFPKNNTLALLFVAYFILQVEIASICFGISSFLDRGGSGSGLGLAALFYFLNIIANLTDQAQFLKYITPFGYTEGADIVATGQIELKYLSLGILFTAIGAVTAFLKYRKKDIS